MLQFKVFVSCGKAAQLIKQTTNTGSLEDIDLIGFVLIQM